MIFTCGIEVPNDVKALIFDLDGTLVDNMPLHIEAWVQSGKDFNIGITAQMIIDNAGIPTRQLITKLSTENEWNVNGEEFTLYKQAKYRSIKADSGPIKRIDEIIEIADYYKDILPMTIGTGSSRQNALSALEDAGILSWFSLVVAADDVDHPKPHPEVFLKGAKLLGLSPSEILVIEDSAKGLEAAVNGGFYTLGIGSPRYLSAANWILPSLEGISWEQVCKQLELA